MEERKSSRAIWIALGSLLLLLAVVGISATAGGIAGYLAGRAAAGAHVCLDESPAELRVAPRGLAPDMAPDLPQLPRGGMPDLDRLDDLPVGALITLVAEGSPAERSGLEVGNIILAINGTPLESDEDLTGLIAEYEPGDTIEISLADLGREPGGVVEVTLGRHPERGGETAYLGITYRMVPVGIDAGRMPFRRR